MRNNLFFIVFIMSLSGLPLAGEEKAKNAPEIVVDANRFLPAHYDCHGKRDKSLGLEQESAQAIFTHAYNSKDYGTFEVGYKRTKFDWGGAFPLRTHTFQNPLVKIGGATFRAPRWGWDANLTFEMMDSKASLWRYAIWQGLIHGAYAVTGRTDLHIGVFAMCGSHYAKVLPIIGINFLPSAKLAVNLIFPTKASILWMIGDHWSIDLAAKLFYTHQRFGNTEHKKYKEGFLTYRNMGLELGGNWEIQGRGVINLHAGYALGGYFTLSNRLNNSQRQYQTKACPYLGLAADLHF